MASRAALAHRTWLPGQQRGLGPEPPLALSGAADFVLSWDTFAEEWTEPSVQLREFSAAPRC